MTPALPPVVLAGAERVWRSRTKASFRVTDADGAPDVVLELGRCAEAPLRAPTRSARTTSRCACPAGCPSRG